MRTSRDHGTRRARRQLDLLGGRFGAPFFVLRNARDATRSFFRSVRQEKSASPRRRRRRRRRAEETPIEKNSLASLESARSSYPTQVYYDLFYFTPAFPLVRVVLPLSPRWRCRRASFATLTPVTHADTLRTHSVVYPSANVRARMSARARARARSRLGRRENTRSSRAKTLQDVFLAAKNDRSHLVGSSREKSRRAS